MSDIVYASFISVCRNLYHAFSKHIAIIEYYLPSEKFSYTYIRAYICIYIYIRILAITINHPMSL